MRRARFSSEFEARIVAGTGFREPRWKPLVVPLDVDRDPSARISIDAVPDLVGLLVERVQPPPQHQGEENGLNPRSASLDDNMPTRLEPGRPHAWEQGPQWGYVRWGRVGVWARWASMARDTSVMDSVFSSEGR
ncbi:hypothetical protein Aglo03_40660 [Actinokineospora globicatena]|uniref:Uncharacterized protein n=1 Tax=Actinokineospora globicatena TaxID=103729 RepID=A0A9W6QR49_9PSEU|nr:hypothetical protein Aglo03_40660 [Actinokineospora globicatena]